MGLLDIDDITNDIHPIFTIVIINLIKSKKTDSLCWLPWKVNCNFYQYNIFSKQLETTIYNFDPKQWYLYQKWGTTEIFICKNCLNQSQRRGLQLSPIRLYGSIKPINLELVLELMK